MQSIQTVLLIGCTGLTGKYVLKALINDYRVYALIRNPVKEPISHKNLKYKEGNAEIYEHLLGALQDVDVVVSAYNTPNAHNTTQPTNAQLNFIKTLIKAMKTQGVNRLICVSGQGAADDEKGEPMKESPKFYKKYKYVADDHYNAYKYIKESGINYVTLHPPFILDQPNDDKYEINQEVYLERFSHEVNAGHIADFIAKELKENKYNKKRIAISGIPQK